MLPAGRGEPILEELLDPTIQVVYTAVETELHLVR